jgi:hypothetical protein
MFAESEVMFTAMLKLMYLDDNPSLSVHDSLIVPASMVKEASEAITFSLHAKRRVVPILKVKPPLTSPLDNQGDRGGRDRGLRG